MTYWARLDVDGPWLEVELLIGSSSFELRPRAPAVGSATVAFDSVARVAEPHPVPDPGERTLEVALVDGRNVAVRGPASGIAALEAAVRHASPRHDAPVAAPPAAPAGSGASAGEAASRRPTAVMAGVVAVFVVLIALWTYRADQGELAARARARRSAATSTTTTAPAMPEAQVEGATTVPRDPDPLALPAGPTPTTTTAAPGTSSTVADQPAAAPSTSTAPTTVGSTAPGPRHTFVGTVTVRQAQSTSGGVAPVCGGIGALRDITTGATVSVLDASGRTVARGMLGACRFVAPEAPGIPGGPPPGSVGTASVLPQFDLTIPDVPDADSYRLQVLHYDPVGFTKAQLGDRPVWRVGVAISI